jgi:ATPase subunit of ABC transporter with duplicated ATPase domains
MEKIQLDEVIASSRQSPYITYTQHKKLHRLALEMHNLSHGFEGEMLFTGGDILLEAGQKLAVIGENGSGKTTFLRCLVSQLKANAGTLKWSENAVIGYLAQDVSNDFGTSMNLFDWMSQWRTPKHDDLAVRAMLGRLLFSADDIAKDVKVCSGGEKNRLMFGKLMMQEINVIIMDEPTNHMDMEAIEALNKALKAFDGTLIFVSHDREFVSTLATSIIEVKNNTLNYFQGRYDEYVSNA